MTIDEVIERYKISPILSSREAKECFEKLKNMDFDPSIHYPIIYLYLHYAQLEKARELLDLNKNKDDQVHIDLDNILLALEECMDSGWGVFPLTVPFSNWWNGPHTNLPKKVNDLPLKEWVPARLIEVTDGKVHLVSAKLVHNEIQYVRIEVDREKLGCNFELPDGNYDGDPMILEIGFYGETEGVFVTRCHDLRDINWPPKTIKPLIKTIQPVLDQMEKKLKEFEESFHKS